MISKNLWGRLTPANRTRFHLCLLHLHFDENFRHPAVIFAIKASLITFALLLIMPLHPMAIPTALGGGTAIAMISHSIARLSYQYNK